MLDHGKIPNQRSKNSETLECILYYRSSGKGRCIKSAFWTFPPCCHGHIVSPISRESMKDVNWHDDLILDLGKANWLEWSCTLNVMCGLCETL